MHFAVFVSCWFLINISLFPGRPEKLEVSQGMQLEQVKRKIPSVLFSWDTYSASREGQSGAALKAALPENAGVGADLYSNLALFYCSDEMRNVLQPIWGGGWERQTHQWQCGGTGQQAGEGPDG